MLYVRIPADKPFFKSRVTLDGSDFVLRFEWNMRSGWFLGISAVGDNGSETVICQPRKLLPDRNHLQFITSSLRPRGWLVAIDGSGASEAPGFTDLGTRHPLAYLDEDEVAAMFARVT